ncbi:MAG: hypothetical protein Q8R97_11660 [Brevundimonas sp.]|nr:hypothetical protein [Brevundimonas sp.]MDP3401767.1 hypothetical protein [Brevundimonas sp.]MDZ4113549.1 hypothetical protein [Brevundimonas sp.]
MTEVKSTTNSQRQWIEPEISELAVPETAGINGIGGDGNPVWPDCTRS